MTNFNLKFISNITFITIKKAMLLGFTGVFNNKSRKKAHTSNVRILFLFLISYESVLSKQKHYSSSLLSLSNYALFLIIPRIYSLCSEPYIFESPNPKIYRVSLNLLESFDVRNNTIMYCLFSFGSSYRVARQGPAVAVTPVFTPINPGLLNNLFVFSHLT